MNIAQQRISSGIILAVAATVCWISFTQSPAAAYLFPRLISVFFALFAAITFVKALAGKSQTGAGLTLAEVKRALPGVIIAAVYAFWAAKNVGFYLSTTIVFFVLLSLYDPAPHTEMKSWIKRVAITAGFIIIMYLLFAKLLFVFTPRGMYM